MAISALIAEFGLQVVPTGSGADLSLSVGTEKDAANRVGLFSDLTVGQEYLSLVAGASEVARARNDTANSSVYLEGLGYGVFAQHLRVGDPPGGYTPVNGDLWYDTGTDQFQFYQDGATSVFPQIGADNLQIKTTSTTDLAPIAGTGHIYLNAGLDSYLPADTNTILIGSATSLPPGDESISLGHNAAAASAGSIVIGTGSGGVGLTSDNALALGTDAQVTTSANALALGAGTLVNNHANSVALGYQALTTKANQIVLGAAANHTEVLIPVTTTSTTSATGALVVAGGVGVAENLNVGGFTRTRAEIEPVTATGTLARENNKKVIVTTNSITLSLWTTGIQDGDQVYIRNKSGGNITVDTAGAETIEGGASQVLADGDVRLYVYYAATTDWTVF